MPHMVFRFSEAYISASLTSPAKSSYIFELNSARPMQKYASKLFFSIGLADVDKNLVNTFTIPGLC